MKTHSRVQYTATIGDRVRRSAQARTIVGWMYEDATMSPLPKKMFSVNVRNIHTDESITVYVEAGWETLNSHAIELLVSAKKELGA